METTTQKTNILETEKIGKLLIKFSVPGIISMIVNALYNIVDQIFIGHGVGYLGNGATNVIFPLSTFAMAFALMIGDGTASYMSLMLGKKEERKAARGTAVGLIVTVLSGIILAAVYLILLEPLCTLFGATPEIIPYALQYGGITAIGLPFCAVCAGYASIIRADGSPKFNMVGLLTGCVINLIGDPLFIFVFHWGVAGAAWATILGQAANAIINFCYIPKFKSITITKDDVKHCFGELPKVLKLGVSSFISQMVLVVVMAVQNNLMCTYGAQSEYGASIPVSALGVTMKVFNILMVIVIGLAAGAQPIWGYNYGARLYNRVKVAFHKVMLISSIVMIVAFIIFQCFPMAIISIFGSEDALYNKFAIKTLRVFLLLVPVAGFQLAAGIFFQSVGRPVLASIISLSKQIIFSIPAMFILCPLIGVEGILWSGPVADALSFVLTVLMLTVSWKRIFNPKEDLSPSKKISNETLQQQPEKTLLETAKDAMQNEMPETFLHAATSPRSAQYTINGKPTVICISRSYGSGGHAIGKKVAQDLRIPFYDKEIVDEAALESGLNAMFLAFADEKSITRSVTPGAAGTFGADQVESDKVQRAAEEAQAAVIEKISNNGSCVIVGRRADQILKGKTQVFSVFIDKPFAQRITTVQERENISVPEAEKLIRTNDKNREHYYNFSANDAWGKLTNYDLCINAGTISLEKAASLIEDAAKSL